MEKGSLGINQSTTQVKGSQSPNQVAFCRREILGPSGIPFTALAPVPLSLYSFRGKPSLALNLTENSCFVPWRSVTSHNLPQLLLNSFGLEQQRKIQCLDRQNGASQWTPQEMTLGALNPLGLTFLSQELFPKQMQTHLVWNQRNLQDQALVPRAEQPSPWLASIPADRAGQSQSLTVSASVKWRQPCLLGHAIDWMDQVWKGFVIDQVPARFLREAAAVMTGATLSPSFSSLGLGWPPQAWACPYTLYAVLGSSMG